jgi:hypothetical protein
MTKIQNLIYRTLTKSGPNKESTSVRYRFIRLLTNDRTSHDQGISRKPVWVIEYWDLKFACPVKFEQYCYLGTATLKVVPPYS